MSRFFVFKFSHSFLNIYRLSMTSKSPSKRPDKI
jgi:hypothetical protein